MIVEQEDFIDIKSAISEDEDGQIASYNPTTILDCYMDVLEHPNRLNFFKQAIIAGKWNDGLSIFKIAKLQIDLPILLFLTKTFQEYSNDKSYNYVEELAAQELLKMIANASKAIALEPKAAIESATDAIKSNNLCLLYCILKTKTSVDQIVLLNTTFLSNNVGALSILFRFNKELVTSDTKLAVLRNALHTNCDPCLFALLMKMTRSIEIMPQSVQSTPQNTQYFRIKKEMLSLHMMHYIDLEKYSPKSGLTKLHQAAQKEWSNLDHGIWYNLYTLSDKAIAKVLEVKSKTDGATALHYAAASSNLLMMQLLLAFNADINAKNNLGQSPIDLVDTNHKNSQAIISLLQTRIYYQSCIRVCA